METNFSTGDQDPQEGWLALTALISDILPDVIPNHGFPQKYDHGGNGEGTDVTIPNDEALGSGAKCSFRDCLMKYVNGAVSTYSFTVVPV
jgi:hypothetical protein